MTVRTNSPQKKHKGMREKAQNVGRKLDRRNAYHAWKGQMSGSLARHLCGVPWAARSRLLVRSRAQQLLVNRLVSPSQLRSQNLTFATPMPRKFLSKNWFVFFRMPPPCWILAVQSKSPCVFASPAPFAQATGGEALIKDLKEGDQVVLGVCRAARPRCNARGRHRQRRGEKRSPSAAQDPIPFFCTLREAN